MKTKLMDEPEFERVRDWLAQYGLRVITDEHYEMLEHARFALDCWKWKAWSISKNVPQPVIGPPCPPHLNWLRAAPKPLEPPPVRSPLHTDV